jgi:hypothetical protein
VVNAPGFDAAVVSTSADAEAGGARARDTIARLAAALRAIGEVAAAGVDVLGASIAELASEVRRRAPRRPEVADEDVELMIKAMHLVAAAEHGETVEQVNAQREVGAAIATPLVGLVDRELNVTNAAIRLAALAHEQSLALPGEPCCMLCALGTESARPDPLALVRPVPKPTCATGLCAVRR